MTTQPGTPTAAPAHDIVATCLLDAACELAWHALTDPAQVIHWWGPDGFTTTVHEHDLRPGGVWHLTMHGPDGAAYPSTITLHEIVPPTSLVYAHTNDGAEHIRDAFSFRDEDGRTRLTMSLRFATAEARDRAIRDYHLDEAMRQTLARLAAYLAPR